MPRNTVFVVDDDLAVADSLRALLETAGHRVEARDSAEAFLEDIAVAQTAGCLILDVRMPGLSGLDLQKLLRERGFDFPIVVLTGHGDVRMAVEAMRAGAFEFMEKPYRGDQLLDVVTRALATGSQGERPGVATAEILARLEKLSPREREVFDRVVAGQSNKAIARDLAISPRTVEIHRARMMEKMESDNLAHLVRLALSSGISR